MIAIFYLYCMNLFGCWHYKFSAFGDTLWPTLHHALLLGIEANAFFAICMHIAKEGFLPATKTMPCHWHWNRYVNTDHANLYTTCKFTSDIAIAGKAGYTIAKLARVNEI